MLSGAHLPDVHDQDGLGTSGEGGLRIGRLLDGQLAVVHNQPRPPGAKLQDRELHVAVPQGNVQSTLSKR